MAEGGRGKRIAKAPDAAPGVLPEPGAAADYAPLITALGGMLDFPNMLAIADILPVMTAYVDRDLVYRFANKPFADWWEKPRKAILGTPMRELIGADVFDARLPILNAALAGE